MISNATVNPNQPATFQMQRGGGKGIRTPDLQLAKLPLYQLSYAPDFTRAAPMFGMLKRRDYFTRFRVCRAKSSRDAELTGRTKRPGYFGIRA